MKSLLLAFSLLLSFVTQTIAADVFLTSWRGHKVLSIKGSIEEGDALKVAELLPTANKMPYGTPIVVLEGPGGSVGEALKISRIFDSYPVHTVITKGSKCASACGSIIFIAGKYRTLEEGAALGQHSCSMGGRRNDECNEVIANHAIQHGVSHGAIAAFVTFTPPEGILWFSRSDAEGWGLTRYPGEDMSGFEKSEPRALKLIVGEFPLAQPKWRIGFRENGFDAFVRTSSDFEREMQISLFCLEQRPGRMFLAMEITGTESAVKDAVAGVAINTDVGEWISASPAIYQKDELMSELFVEVPKEQTIPLMKEAEKLQYGVMLRKPYEQMIAQTLLEDSRKVLLFAANNCVK